MDRAKNRGDQARDENIKHPQLVYLKRKLEDLEEVHRNGKRVHLEEVEALKLELDRSRKTSSSQTERLKNFKKQQRASETRLHELQGQLTTYQSEIKELNYKLRTVEEERNKLSGRQVDAGALRRAFNSAEAKRLDELQEKDRRILELERALAQVQETTRTTKARLEVATSSSRKELQEVSEQKAGLEQELQRKRQQLCLAEVESASMRADSQRSVDDLKCKLLMMQENIERITAAFKHLASSTKPLSAYEEQRNKGVVLQLHAARLERKLADTQEQVLELTQFVRQTQATNSILQDQLKGVEEELSWRLDEIRMLRSTNTLQHVVEDPLAAGIRSCEVEDLRGQIAGNALIHNVVEKQIELCQEESKQLLRHLAASQRDLISHQAAASQTQERLSGAENAVTKLSSENTKQKKDLNELVDENSRQVKEIYALQAQLEEINQALAAAEERTQEEVLQREDQLRKERDLSSKLQMAVQQSKMAENALKDQIVQLSNEVAEAEGYQSAYETLAEEMRGLVARNSLAEEEANRLSQFNAEILSHHNPTQRIFYVDRIRRELAETKQQLALCNQNYEGAIAETTRLKEELGMYKSIQTPIEGKPRTNMTRVRRVPLAARSLNKQPPIRETRLEHDGPVRQPMADYDIPDMTLDELT